MKYLRFHVIVFATAFVAACSPQYPLFQLLKKTELSTEEREALEKYIKRSAPDEDAFVAVQRLAEPYVRSKEWDKALEVYAGYRPMFKGYDARFDEIESILSAPAESVTVTNLGPGINSPAIEGLPLPQADGNLLYFTGKGRTDSWGAEDIYVSRLERGEWSQAKNLGSGINTESNESATSISADGTRLFIFGSYPESFGRGDIFFSEKTASGWAPPRHIERPINTVYFESDAFISADGKALFFTSERPGNQGSYHPKDEPFHANTWGNTDIYVCAWQDTGWGEPVNLGSAINTPYAERTPFLHPDGKTLYFSSDGHPGMGRLDVFKSIRLSDTSWALWSEPRNLGKEVNTAGDDIGYNISTSGERAYFSAYGEKAGYGAYDIYSITLPGQARPKAVATFRGRVKDEKGRLLEAAIKWENLATGGNAGELKSDPKDGAYFIALPLGANYGYYAEKEGYYPISKSIDLSNTVEPVEIEEDIILVSIKQAVEAGTPVRINNIFFDFDQYTLKPESYPELKRLAQLLDENKGLVVEIAGHTDDVGSDAYNMELSLKRARAVAAYLAAQGCPEENLVPKGYGKTKPLTTNETEEGRAENRRVEFKFVKQPD